MFQLTVRYCYAIANALTLVRTQKLWFDNVTTDSVEFYLATGYMNFTIANKIIISAKFWKEGLPNEFKDRDEHAKQILEKAFPGRKIVQIDCMPLHHDGGGIHCHSRNQPKGKIRANTNGKQIKEH